MRTESFSSRGSVLPSVPTVTFSPKATIYCLGSPSFRSKAARDLGCLLDVDLTVKAWECLPFEMAAGDSRHTPDFLVTYLSGRRCLLDASESGNPLIAIAAENAGFAHEFVPRQQREEGWRLRNARDLLRYGNHKCPLGDRIRVLATLDDVGSFTIADGLSLFREISPVAGLATLILHRILSVDLDDALIGPDTVVRRASE